MSNEIRIEMPGLTEAVAIELGRRADLLGAPFTFVPPRRAGRLAAERPARVVMVDLREEPDIASETLDHPEGWPQSDEVRQWLERATHFLGDNAPQQRFTFQAGWGDNQRPTTKGEIDLGAFLGLIAAGQLRADERYAVRWSE